MTTAGVRLARSASTSGRLDSRTSSGRIGRSARSSRDSAASGKGALRDRRPRRRAENSPARRRRGGDRAESSLPPRSLARGRPGSRRPALPAARVGAPRASARMFAGRDGDRRARYSASQTYMLPRPAMRFWSSSPAFSDVRASANRFAKRPASNSGANGSSPSPRSLGCVSSASIADRSMKPKRRGSLYVTTLPLLR